jgi:hypothetical protein
MKKYNKIMRNAVMNRGLTKGKLGTLTFQLNPSNMTHDGGAVWADTPSPGMPNPVTSYSYGNPEIYTFELWFNKKHVVECDVAKAYKTLDKYRKFRDRIMFTYGSLVKNVVVQECTFQIDAWDSKLNVTEFHATISLKVVQ